MSNSLVIRIDCGSIYPDCYDELSDYFKLCSERWFWGFHDKEGNPHYHWLICTDKTDNLIRQEIRKRLHTKGNGAYQCKKLKDLDAYASYVCFKDHTRGYEVHGFDEERVNTWRDRGTEILESKLKTEKKKKQSGSVDALDLIFKELGPYDWNKDHYYNGDRFMNWMRRHGTLTMYGRYRIIFMAWRDKSVVEFEPDDGFGEDEAMQQMLSEMPEDRHARSLKLYSLARKDYKAYKLWQIDSLFCY